MRHRTTRPAAAAALFFLLALRVPATTITYTWTGGAGNNNWSKANNWGGTAPVSSLTDTLLVLAGSTRTNNTLDENLSANQLTYDSSASSFTTSGTNTLTLGTGGIVNNSSGAQTLSAPIALGATQTWTNNGGLLTVDGGTNNGGFGLTVSGSGNTKISAISGAGSLTMSGSGTLTLRGSNTYGGGTTIAAGTLQIGNGGTGGSVSGDILDNSALVFNRSDNYTYSGAISGSGTVTQAGSGILKLRGSNNYSGGTTISSGTLNFNSIGNLGTGGITLSGGALQWASGNNDDISSQTVTVSSNSTLDTGSNNVTLAHAIGNNGSGGLTLAGTGTLTFKGNNTYTGVTTISAGTLQIGNGGANGSVAGDIVNNSTLVFDRSNTYTYSGAISGSGTVVQAGTGILRLRGTNNYTGGTVISSGILSFASSSNLGTGGITLAGGMLRWSTSGNSYDISSQTVTISADSALDTRAKNVTLANAIGNGGSGALYKFGTGTLTFAGNNTYTGATVIDAGALQIGNGGTSGSVAGDIVDNSLLVFNRSDNYTYSGAISGSGLLFQAGSGTLTLDGANTFTGIIGVESGNIVVTVPLPDEDSTHVFLEVARGGVLADASEFTVDELLGGSYAGIGSTSVGDQLTSADILYGTNSSGVDSSVGMQWTDDTGNPGLQSDILNLTGMVNDGSASGQTDLYVLQMSYDPTGLSLSTQQQLFLAYFNGAAWVNAIFGNFGTNSGSFFLGGWINDAAHDALGSWGVDTTNDVVWAVLNHNSEFAVGAPEPGALALWLGGLALCLIRRRAIRN